MEKTGFAQKNGRLFRLALLVCLSCALFTAKAQTARITLNLQNATLEQAMDKIKAQTRYLFINRDVEDLESRKVSINVSNELITKVLDQLFTPFDIGYDIDGRSIFIYKQQAAAARPVPVSGRVTDASGQPIIGASVIVRGTTLGVSTDAEGNVVEGTVEGGQTLTGADAAHALARKDGAILFTDVPTDVEPSTGREVSSEVVLAGLAYANGFSPEFIAQIQSLSLPSVDAITAYLDSGIEVSLGAPDDIETKERVVTRLLEQQQGVTYINVRVPDNYTFRSAPTD